MKTKENELWKTGFGERYVKTVIPRVKLEYTQGQVSFMEEVLGLSDGESILDAGCGQGRHSIEFAKRGYSVTGFEFSNTLLDYAKNEAFKNNVDIDFVQGDLRGMSYKGKFDTVISILAFGFLDKEEHNLLVFQNIANSLKPRGKFFLMVSNSTAALNRMRSSEDVKEEDGVLIESKEALQDGVLIQTRIELDTNTMKHTVVDTWEKEGIIHEEGSTVRMFTYNEIEEMAHEVGLRVQEKWGDFDGSDFTPQSSRLLVLLEKSPGE